MGDLNSRRGRILGIEATGRQQVVEAIVPQAEIFEYSRELRALTQGRGNFEAVYDHYDRVPQQIQDKLIASSTMEEEADD
jgi:elongation factor G